MAPLPAGVRWVQMNIDGDARREEWQ